MQTFLDFVLLAFVFFFLVMAFSIFVRCLMDIFVRRDLSGLWKVIWLIILFSLPLLGSLIYLLLRPAVTAQDVQELARMEAAQKAAAGVSTADELAKLAQLRDAGTINAAEYEAMKKKIVG